MPRCFTSGTSAPRLDCRGVALPLALLGLVVVSLMVTAALLTSSTELSLSGAHQDGVDALYDADNALEQYIGRKAAGAGGNPVSDSLFPISNDTRIPGMLVTVSRLRTVESETPDSVKQRQEYAIVAEPANRRGRSAGTLLTATRAAKKFDLNVQAGMTTGGNLKVSGNSTVSDSSTTCNMAGAQNAVQVSSGSSITVSGSAKIDGKADTATYSKDQMVSLLLGGMSLQEAASKATIKFAAGEFDSSNKRAKSYDSSGPRPRSDKYNWGCPRNSGDPCVTAAKNATIDNTTYYPSVAIDAGGGTVVLNGDHGQGVLIIHNGSFSIQGNFIFEGILLVEKDLSIKGTGSGTSETKISGAVLALGESSTIDDNISGNAVISYDQCAIASAEAAFNDQRLDGTGQKFVGPRRWFELVR
jgi:hypothetical protein